jgi:CRISPR/Cas system CSM-associated protein Csm3 (group 7 of RAMP superfamily)
MNQRLDIAFTITWEAGWHVGSGQGTVAVDRLVRRRACGPRGKRVPFVPGSQIKGVLRHNCERIAALLGAEVVSPHVVDGPADDLLQNFRPLSQSNLLIDRLFGSRYQGDCLFVEDAIPATPVEQPLQIHSRTSIDRVSGTARENTLFVSEVAPARGPNLTSRVQARHPVGALTQFDDDTFPYEYSLLLAGLLTLEMLGGDKSAGLGKCRVTIQGDNGGSVRWNDRNYPLAEALNSFTDFNEHDYEWLEWLTDNRAQRGG